MSAHEVDPQVIAQFRAGGPVEGMHRERLLLLTTTGRRSGLQRTSPMMFHPDPAGPVVIASNDGARADPAWFRNLVDEPRVHVELPDRAGPAVAEVLDGEEYAEAWAALVAGSPFLEEHAHRAGRRIPLVRLRLA